MLVKSTSFWIATGIFLVACLGIVWLVFPKLISKFRLAQQTLKTANEEVAKTQQFLNTVETLNKNLDDLGKYNEAARLALPTTTEPEQLLLQLNGLIADLKLDATVTVPISKTTGTSTTSGASSGVKAGSIGGGTVVSNENANTDTGVTFTINGKFGFGELQTLIGRLRTFSRWNKIQSIDITRSDSASTVSITGQVFSKPLSGKEFSAADPQFLKKAGDLFGGLRSYATIPDITQEGSYGRKDPFAGL
ncbi:MAG: hypothetical protein HZB70_03780 [Candidatus Berkelbacteria bacterium]|nr:MAG: hypothetical protein HZB70_03780 [Candidatus Berkelbacteria bacterium]QQG51581.1 MAG: hypothetical protein HY845_03410 [Candidatus Berkelbacteria bacterium]